MEASSPISPAFCNPGLLQFQVFNRLHFCRIRLSRLYPDIDPTCSRCHQPPATLYHMYWSCPTLGPFWCSIFETFSYICNKKIAPTPFCPYYWGAPEDITFCITQAEAIAFSSLLARAIPRHRMLTELGMLWHISNL